MNTGLFSVAADPYHTEVLESRFNTKTSKVRLEKCELAQTEPLSQELPS